MKQKLLHSFTLRVCLLVAMFASAVSGAWAQNITFDFEDDSAHRTTGSNSYSSNTYEQNGVAIGLTYADAVSSGSPLSGSYHIVARVAKNTTNSPVIKIGEIDNTGYKITGINYNCKGQNAFQLIVEYSTDNTTWTKAQEVTEMPTTKTAKTITGLNISEASFYLRFTISVHTGGSTGSNRDANLDDIVIVREANVNPSLTTSDFTLTGTPVALSFDLYNNASAQTVSYTTSSTGAITVSGGEGYVTTSVDATNKTITVTPTAVTPSAQTITISQAADENYAAGEATFTVTVSNSATYTVTLGDDNTELVETAGGAGVTLPSRNNVGDYTFAGWSEENVTEETTTAPTIITIDETYYPAADITLYPVYTKTEGGGASAQNASVTISDYAQANNWAGSGAQAYAEVVLNSDITATTTGTGNNGKYYSDWRFYQNGNGNVIISTTQGELSSVTFTFTNSNGGTLNYDSSALMSGTAVEVSGNSAEFTVGNSGSATNGQIRITAIAVTYTVTSSTTYYWSSPVAATVERPTITVTSPFTISTSVEMACETDGATIYYTLDGTDPTSSSTEYTVPFDINATTTIKAIAIKGNDESLVATATATKQLATPTVTVSGNLTVDLDGGTDINAGTLTAAVTYNEAAVAGATVTWSSSNNDIATIDANTGAVTILTTGEVTFTATYAGNSDYAEATGTKTITVIDSNAPGATQANPYSVAQARAAIDAGTGTTNVYVAGIVSQVDSYNSTYHSITYWISEDGTTTNQFEVYSGKGISSADFSSINDIQLGDEVVVYGDIKKYNSTYEFDYNNYLVSLVRKQTATITVTGGTEFTIDRNNNEEELTLTATANSGATVVFTVDTENTTISGSDYAFENGTLLVSGNNAGVIIIKANAAAAGEYKAAEEVTITVNILGVKSDAVIVVQNDDVAYGSTYTIDTDMIEGGDITVTSSNEAVATVNGLTITPVAVGTTTITVATAEDATYNAGSETFTLTVTAPEGKTTAAAAGFVKVTSTSDITDGQYLIVYEDGGVAFNGGLETLDNTENTIAVTISDGKIEANNTTVAAAFTIDATNGTILSASGKYIGQTSDANGLATNDATSYTNTISFTGEDANIVSGGAYLRYNSASNQLRFRYYKSASYEGQKAIQLYKLSEANLTATLNASGYATYCSEYPLDFSDDSEFSAWEITGISGSEITFNQITGTVKGGTGVFLKGTAGETVTLTSADNNNTLSDNLLEGIMAPTYVAAGDFFGLKGNEFVPVNAGTVPAGKALLPAIEVPNNVKAFTFVFVNTATGMRTVETVSAEDAKAIFNLAGQRLNKTQRGINIVNGKKVVVK